MAIKTFNIKKSTKYGMEVFDLITCFEDGSVSEQRCMGAEGVVIALTTKHGVNIGLDAVKKLVEASK